VCRLANDVIEQRCNLLRCIGRDWHIASFRCAAKFGRFRSKADNVQEQREITLSRLTQLRHQPRPMDLCSKPVSAPIKVLV